MSGNFIAVNSPFKINNGEILWLYNLCKLYARWNFSQGIDVSELFVLWIDVGELTSNPASLLYTKILLCRHFDSISFINEIMLFFLFSLCVTFLFTHIVSFQWFIITNWNQGLILLSSDCWLLEIYTYITRNARARLVVSA